MKWQLVRNFQVEKLIDCKRTQVADHQVEMPQRVLLGHCWTAFYFSAESVKNSRLNECAIIEALCNIQSDRV